MTERFFYRGLGLFLNTLNSVAPSKSGQLGFKFFCSPSRRKITKSQYAFLRTAEETDIKFNGKLIRHYRWGNGPKKIVFLHGWQSASFRWNQYIELLSKNPEYTLLAFDAPAHGQSEGKQFTVPAYASLINKVLEGYGAIHAVVTHSIGSFSFFYAYAKHKLPNINKLIALSTPGSATEFISFYKKSLHLNSNTVKSIVEEFQSIAHDDLDKISLPYLAKNLSIPGLIVHDQKDGLTDFSNARLLHQHWTQAELMTTTGLGHRLRSPEVVNAVLNFIK
ncbi:alpha/beta hydrolase [uncultured Cyclobacterium sp.]|uniref:alpha/beta fold hydrolase n=1 Tax=uncultured Cyclobacterium sp. TaxID=453820 RepID=UPI0030EB8CE0|tara:strand:- start:26159 stop:26992 length:834 start_codon:yes stop_codon:yes gene_type:complete